MTDGVALPASGVTIDAEYIAARLAYLQRMKLVLGALDTDGGDVTPTNPMPTIASGANVFQGTGNTSVAQLAATATFTGTIESIFNQIGISINVFADQPLTITLNQYQDAAGLKKVISKTYTVSAGAGFSMTEPASSNYFNITVQNTGASTTTTLAIDVVYGTVYPASVLNNLPVALAEFNGALLSKTNQIPASPDGTNDAQTFSGSLAAIGTFVTLTAAQLLGMQSVNFAMTASGSGCTLVVQQSFDNGATWDTQKFYRNDVATTAETVGFVNAAVGGNFSVPVLGNGIRITLSAWTSGTYTIVGVIKRTPIPAPGYVNAGVVGANSSVSGYTPPSSTGTGAFSVSRITSAAASGLISAGGHRVCSWNLVNTNAAVRYLHLYNKATAPTVGTDTPLITIPLGIGQTLTLTLDAGVYFNLGLGYAVTSDDPAIPATAGAAGDIQGTIYYI